jgi:hypothetical protein
MNVDRVILLGMMDNYHKLATAGEKLALLINSGECTPRVAYDTARTLASFGQYMLDALERVERWGYADWLKRTQEALHGKRS